jgi:hypothetical protein
MGDELLTTALRVLNAYLNRTEPSPAEVNFLRQAVPPPQSHWEADELACFIVRIELAARRQAPLSDIERARAEWLDAVAEMNDVIAEVPNAIPHPDGQLRIQKAGAKRKAAYTKYMELLTRSDPAKPPSEE